MTNCQFIIRNSENEVIKASLYISPSIVPNAQSPNIVVGNSVYETIGGANIDPIISLYNAPYKVRIIGAQFETIFDIDLTDAPTGSTVNAVNYIV
jgi:hypothetical protein